VSSDAGILQRAARLGAGFIDGVILGVILIVGSSALSLFYTLGVSYLGALLIEVLIVAYTTMDIFKAATPGKQLLHLVIRNQDGTPASRDVLVKRWAIKSCGSIINLLAVITTLGVLQFVGGLGGIVVVLGTFLIFTEGKQALHDKFAGTAVFKS